MKTEDKKSSMMQRRPWRSAYFADGPLDGWQIVGAMEAADLMVGNPEAKFMVGSSRVYPKPSVGKFARWPGTGNGRGVTAEETRAHRVAKEVLAARFVPGSEFRIQPVDRRDRDVGKQMVVQTVCPRLEAPIRHRGPRSRLQPDILLLVAGGPLGFWIAIEVRNTHAVNHRKRRLLQGLPLSTIEIDVRDFASPYQSEEQLRNNLTSWLAGAIRARVLTQSNEFFSRLADDAILTAAIRPPSVPRPAGTAGFRGGAG